MDEPDFFQDEENYFDILIHLNTPNSEIKDYIKEKINQWILEGNNRLEEMANIRKDWSVEQVLNYFKECNEL